MRVLVLDDDDNRHDYFRMWLAGEDVTHVHTAAAAIAALAWQERFDLVCLDHDLDLAVANEYGVGDAEQTGADVAEYIRLHLAREKYPAQILIHSWNPSGARRMEALVREVGIPTVVRPFGLGLGAVLRPRAG